MKVARGIVEVATGGAAHARLRLAANQAVQITDDGPQGLRRINAAKELSWVDGRLVLENRTLSAAVAEINRFYHGRIILLHDASGGRPINAVIDLANINDWLAGLDRTGTAKVVKVGPVVLLH